MAVPNWFEVDAYFANKAKSMNMDVTDVMQAFISAGFGTSAEGAYQHFLRFGNTTDPKEKISPNSWFDSNEYVYAKAAALNGTNSVTENQAKSVDLAFSQAGMTPWDHYQIYWKEYADKGLFVSPSVNFDATKYMQDKLAKVQADPTYGPTYTMAQLVDVFAKSGLNPLTHYLSFGHAEGLKPSPVGEGTPGQTINLTANDEALYGSAGDDYFYAGVGTLGDNDYIDGGAGKDTLYANIKGDGSAIQPEVTNVETILFRAQTTATTGGGNNVPDAYIDAGNISLAKGQMLTIGSDNSRANLSIEDVRHNSTETTIRFADADPGNGTNGPNLEVFFDSQHLKSADSQKSGTLTLKIIDGEFAPAGKPLQTNPYDSVKFTYNGKVVEVKFGEVKGNATYDDMVKAIQKAIDADPALKGLTAVKGDPFTFVNKDGVTVTGSEINISTDNGTVSKDGGAWLASGGVPGDSNVSTSMGSTTAEGCPLIQTNVELDNVGRVQWNDANPNCLPDDIQFGGQGSKLVVGGMGVRDGVERFDVTVDRGSWLSSLSSTNNVLRMVTVTGEDINKDGIIGNVGAQANNKDKQTGQLFIGTSREATADENKSWTSADKMLNTDGLTDVKYFRASNEKGELYTGDIFLGAAITAESLPKYMADVDGLRTMYDKYAPDGAFQYTLGTGNDSLNMSVHSGIAADRDFQLNINTNAGKDLVNFTFDFKTVNNVIDQTKLNNVSINTGDGNDTVWTWGTSMTMNSTLLGKDKLAYDGVAGAVIVDAGTGDDAVYTAQDGAVNNSVWVLNGNTPNPYNENPFGVLLDPNGEAQPLQNNVASTVNEYTVAGKAAGTYALSVTVNFLGVAVTAQVGSYTVATGGTSYKVSIEDINKALLKAINEDAVLSKLLQAQDGAGYSLLVQSLIDGQYDLADFGVSFSDKTGNTTTNVDSSFGDFVNQGALEDSEQTWTTEGLTTPANNEVFNVTIDGKMVTFTATTANLADVVTGLNNAFDAAFGAGKVVATASGTELTFTSPDKWINDLQVSGDGFTGTTVDYDYTNKVEGEDHHYYGKSTITGGTGNDVIATGYADAIVKAGDGNDTIIAGNKAFVDVYGGKGADHIYLGNDNTATVGTGLDKVFQGVGDSAYTTGATTALSTVNLDVVFNFDTGANASDHLVLSSYTGTGAVLTAGANATTWAGLDAVGNNSAAMARGTYNEVTKTFTLGTGAGDQDWIVVYDADSGTAVARESVVLVGVGTNPGTLTANNDTVNGDFLTLV